MASSYPTASLSMALKVCCLLLLLIPAQAAATRLAPATQVPDKTIASDSIHFIVLPYLCAFHRDQHNQPSILRHDKNQHDLSDHQWLVTITSAIDFSSQHSQLEVIDHDQYGIYSLTADLHNIIIPMPSYTRPLLPIEQRNSASSALWLHYNKKNITAWHAPSLTPAVQRQRMAEKKRNARLAERMAERAFYFGYDTNDDALK